jgi:S-methylmethionine-dependent homocysteine/selenocysteine methylase
MYTSSASLPSSVSSSAKLLCVLFQSLVSSKSDAVSSAPRKLKHTNVFLLDGGTGEELISLGVPYDSRIWSARAITDDQYHTTVQKVHESFIASGCDAITTNTYGIVPGVGFTKAEIAHYCAVAGGIARSSVHAKKEIPGDPMTSEICPIFVLGSLGPLIESYRADNVMPRVDGIEYYDIMIDALYPNVDAFIAETLSSSEEAIQVLLALSSQISNHQRDGLLSTNRNTYTDVLFISFTVNDHGHLRSDETIVTAMSKVLDYHTSKCSNVQRKYVHNHDFSPMFTLISSFCNFTFADDNMALRAAAIQCSVYC